VAHRRSASAVPPEYLLYGGAAVAAFAVAWAVLVLMSRDVPREHAGAPVESGAADRVDTRTINATFFYVSDDGMRLVGTERQIPYEEETLAQARRLIEALLEPPPAPLWSPFPEGTSLRALYLTQHGDAFVDLSPEVSAGHSGGSLEELFTVYALVNTLTVNLPAISAVQILVGGREVDTLAGHVDLRHPLEQNLKWTTPPGAEAEG